MKKILAMLLAGAMVVGMASTAFAANGNFNMAMGVNSELDINKTAMDNAAGVAIEKDDNGIPHLVTSGTTYGSTASVAVSGVSAANVPANMDWEQVNTALGQTASPTNPRNRAFTQGVGGYEFNQEGRITVRSQAYVEDGDGEIDVMARDIDIDVDDIIIPLVIDEDAKREVADHDRVEVSGDITITIANGVTVFDADGTGMDLDLIITLIFDDVVLTETTTSNTFLDGDEAERISAFAEDAGLVGARNGLGGYEGIADVDNDDRGDGEFGSVRYGTIRPVDEIDARFYLNADMFNINDGQHEWLGRVAVDAARIAARVQTNEGSAAIKDGPKMKYDAGRAYVDVDFLTEFTSVGTLDFDFIVYLTIEGKSQNKNGAAARVTGTLENEHRYISNTDSYDLSEQVVIHAEEFNDDIRLDLGAGVSVYTKLFKDKEYYGLAKRNGDEADDVVMSAHPDIDNVVRLYTVGLNSTGDIVEFNTDYDGYYVYDEDLNFLGMSDERVEFRSVYYLANRKLDVDTDVEPVGDPSEPFVAGGSTGGDKAPTNFNSNPGTGR